MCGRFTQDVDEDDLVDLYDLDAGREIATVRSRWNGAPTQSFAVCRADSSGGRALGSHRWGLVPAWARDLKIGARLINARSETVDSKPAFRTAFRHRRCLVPATGWFEWQKSASGKQPWWISFGGEPFSFAGLWEIWDRGDGPVHSFTILTCPSSPSLRWLHARQPAIVPRTRYGEWLDPASRHPPLLEMARTPHAGPFDRRRVSKAVNYVRNDSPGILRPV